MKRKDIYALGLLVFLTALTALFSVFYSNLKYIVLIVLGLSGIKFLTVAFQFMELRKANSFWKTLILLFIITFIIILSIIL